MQVRPYRQPIPALQFARTPALPAKPGPASTEARQIRELPRFGEYTRPLLTFGSRVQHAVLLNALDQGDNPHMRELREQHPDLVKLNEVRRKMVETVKNAGLDPMDVDFHVVGEDPFLQLSAQDGYLDRYDHWSWGQEYFNQKMERLKARAEGEIPLFREVVAFNEPVQAYLLDRDPAYGKKVMMMYALVRSDFMKNNIYFRNLNRRMEEYIRDFSRIIKDRAQNLAGVIAESAGRMSADELSAVSGIPKSKIERFHKGQMTAEEVGNETVEEFLDKVHSIRNLVDSSRPPRKLAKFHPVSRQNYERDVLGYLVKHSPVLKDWQRDIISIIRQEAYSLLPVTKTRLLSDGWAAFWNEKLNVRNPQLWDVQNMSRESIWSSRIFKLDKLKLNTYQMGYIMFKHIEKDLRAKYANDPQRDKKVLDELLRIRRERYDVSFLRDFLSKDMVESMTLFNFDPEKKGVASQQAGTKLLISDQEFEGVRERLIQMLENAGQPVIQVIDSNYEDKGELLLHHVYAYDLKKDYAQKTMQNLAQLWGKRAHLETRITSDKEEEPKPKILYSDGKSLDERSYTPPATNEGVSG